MGPTQGGGSNVTTGGGMAFYLSPQPPARVLGSYGLYLGLLNSSYAPPFVAIEFDTFRDTPSDPDNNHLGIDIGSTLSSLWAASLTPSNVTLNDFVSGSNTSVWIDYNGDTHELDVYLANQGAVQAAKPAKPFLSRYPINLREHLPSSVFVGFSASTGTYKESHCVISWNFTSTSFPTANPSPAWFNRTLIIGLCVGCLALALVAVFIIQLVLLRKRRMQSKQLLQGLIAFNVGPRRFAYRDLKKATNGFSEASKLGKGAQGTVYRGRLGLEHNYTGVEVAVKVLSERSKQGEREFRAEVESIGRMRHRNLVQLLGWSYDDRRGTLMLVYEYMPNQSLDKWLHAVGRGGGQSMESPLLQAPESGVVGPAAASSSRRSILDWAGRYSVLKDVASGLVYLHEEWEMAVVHRDLKPSNIMLDADFNAKLGDFGLARLIGNRAGAEGTAQTLTIAGTPGYMAPECLETGAITRESDVYSFGAVAMEVATGRRLSAENLHRLYGLYEEGRLIEAAAEGVMAESRRSVDIKKQVELALRMSMACCHPQPSARPTMRRILHALSTFSSPSSGADDPTAISPPPPIDSDFRISSRPYSFFSLPPSSLSISDSLSTTLPASTATDLSIYSHPNTPTPSVTVDSSLF